MNLVSRERMPYQSAFSELNKTDTVANVFTCDILKPLYNVKMSIIEVGSGSPKSLACFPYKTESR